MEENNRVVVWFSCGAASAAASYYAINEYGHSCVHVVYCDTFAEEHEDNERFFNNCREWLNHPIEIIKNEKYKDVKDVWRREQYMAGINGAKCTTKMKKIPRHQYELPGDVHIFGLTADEKKRADRFKNRHPDLLLDMILVRLGVTKNDCLELIKSAGIEIPKMYQLGFKNNNCIGCVKASSPYYWDRVRHYFPEVFRRRAELSRKLGAKLVRVKGKRIYLDELPEGDWNNYEEEDISCGPDCGQEET